MESLLKSLKSDLSAALVLNLVETACKVTKGLIVEGDEQQAIKRVFENASYRFTEALLVELDEKNSEAVSTAFSACIKEQKVLTALVGVALSHTHTSLPVTELKLLLIEAGLDERTLPLNIDAALNVYVKALIFEIDAAAMIADSPIANWVHTGLLRSIAEISTRNNDILHKLSDQINSGDDKLLAMNDNLLNEIKKIRQHQLMQGAVDHRSNQASELALGFESKISSLSSALSKAKNEELESARELYRSGKRSVANACLEALIKDDHWEELEPSIRAKTLRIKASWILNSTDDFSRAKKLIEESKAIAPNDNAQIVEAQYLLRTSSISTAINSLTEPYDINALNYKAVLTLIHSGAQQTQEILNGKPSSWPEDGEYLRLKSLTALLKRERTDALKYAKRAIKEQPTWLLTKRTYAQICYYLSIPSEFWPKEIAQTPEPIPIEVVSTSPESLNHLRTAQQMLVELIDFPGIPEDDLETIQLWFFASVSLDPEGKQSYIDRCLTILSSENCDPRLLLWAATTGHKASQSIDFNYLLDQPSRNIEKIDAATRLLFGNKEFVYAKDFLSRAKEEYIVSGNEEAFRLRWSELLINDGNDAELKNQLDEIKDPQIKSLLQTLLINHTASKEQSPELFLNHLLDEHRKTGETKFLLQYCERAAEINLWNEIVPFVETILAEFQSHIVLRLCVIALWNANKPAECIKFLSKNISLMPSGVLTPELSTLKVFSHIKMGNFDAALTEARWLNQKAPTIENTIILLDIFLLLGDITSLLAEAQNLLVNDDITTEELIRLARLTRTADLMFARTAWKNGVARIKTDTTPNTIAEAYFLSHELGLEQESKPLHQRLEQLDQEGRSPVRAVSLKEMIKMQGEWEVENRRINESYGKGSIPVHFLSESVGITLAEIFHSVAEKNRIARQPATSPVIFTRHGGKLLSQTALKSLKGKNLIADVTSIFSAYDLGILDNIINSFGQISTSFQLSLAITGQIDKLGRGQKSRLQIDEVVLNAIESSAVKIFPQSFETREPRTEFDVAMGPQWMSLINHIKKSNGFLVEHLPLTNNGTSHTIVKKIPRGVKKCLVDAITILKTLERNGIITNSEFLAASANMGDAGRKKPLRTKILLGSKIFFQFNTITMIAMSGLLDLVSEKFDVFVDPRYLDHAKQDIENSNGRSKLNNWLKALQSDIHKHLYSKTIKYTPEPEIPLEKLKEFGNSPESRSILELMVGNNEEDDIIWIDDRYVTSFTYCGKAQIVSTYDLLKGLEECGDISTKKFYAAIESLRASNHRYIPFSSAEILFHLNQAHVEDEKIVETRNLILIRRYLNSCLLDPVRLQRASMPSQTTTPDGELAFIFSCLSAVSETFVKIWEAFPVANDLIRARSNWLFESCYTGLFGCWHLHAGGDSEHQAIELQGIDLANLYVKALQLSSETDDSESNISPFHAFCEWINETIASSIFEATPKVAEYTAKGIKSLLFPHANDTTQTSDEVYAAKYLSRQLFFVAHVLVQDELMKDNDFLEFADFDLGPALPIGDIEFDPSIFWQRVHESFAVTQCGITDISGERKFKLSVKSAVNDKPITVEIAEEGKKVITVVDPIFEILSDLDDAERKLENDFRHWFDTDTRSLKKEIQKFSAAKPLWEKIKILQKWRKNSANVYYHRIRQQFIQDHSVSDKDLIPPSGEGLLWQFRFQDHFSDGWLSEATLNDVGIALIEEEGFFSALDRLSSLPCKLPESVLDLFISLDPSKRDELIDELKDQWISPLHMLHLSQLFGRLAAIDETYTTPLVEITDQVFSDDYDPHFNFFSALLHFMDARFRLWSDTNNWSPEIRKLMAWSHASRLQNLFFSGRAKPGNLVEWVRNRQKLTSIRLTFDRTSIDEHSILSPRVLSKEALFVIGLANVLRPYASHLKTVNDKLFPQIRITQILSDKVYPTLGMMFDPQLATDNVCSVLSGDRHGLLKTFNAAPESSVLRSTHTRKALDMSLKELKSNPYNSEAWATIKIYQLDFSLNNVQLIAFDQIMEGINLADCLKESRPTVGIIMNALGQHTRWSKRENMQDIVTKKLLELAAAIDHSPDLDRTSKYSDDQIEDNNELLVAVVECGLNASIYLDDPERSSQAFASFMVSMYQIHPTVLKTIGLNILRPLSNLPSSQMRNIWPMLLEARARA